MKNNNGSLILICFNCKEEFIEKDYHYSRKYCSRSCAFKGLTRRKDGQIKIIGNKVKNGFLYRMIYKESHRRFVREHRLVMEKKMGRKLKPTDVVHHINGNTFDNRVENLRVYENHNDHNKAHGRAPINEDIEFREDSLKLLYEIFGIDKIIIQEETEYTPSSNNYLYGKKVINYKRECYKELFDEEQIEDFLNKEGLDNYIDTKTNLVNCYTYSKHYLKRRNHEKG